MTATDLQPIQYFIICRLFFIQIAGTFVPPISKNYLVFEEIKAGQGLFRFFFKFRGVNMVKSDVISCKGTIEHNKYMYCIK